MTTMTTTRVETPRWSSEPCTGEHLDAALALFTEPDFYYRTDRPDTLPEWEIVSLLDEDTRLLLADGRPVGLYAMSEAGLPHGCHFALNLRLHAAAPLSWWTAAYAEIVRATRWRSEVVRSVFECYEFDERGRAVAQALGLTDEGTLAGTYVHDGQRSGRVYYSQIWTPS